MANAKSVFISYSSLDSPTADRVIRLLQHMKISYWKAPEMIPAGSSYAREIPKAIRECTIFLLIVSQSSQNSIWVEKEVDSAIYYRRTILPLKIDNVPLNDMFHFYLNNVQSIPYNEDAVAAFQTLQQRLNYLLAEKRDNSTVHSPTNVQNETSRATKDRSNKATAAETNITGNPAETEKPKKDNCTEEQLPAEADDIPRFDPYRGTRSLSMNRLPYRCRYCGSGLQKISRGTYQCIECGKETYDDFQTIRNYLDKAGPTPALTIETDTGVPLKNIEYFLREEYLEIPKLSTFRISCEKCGAPIRTGYLCDQCKRAESQGSSRQTSSGAWRTGKRN